MSNIVPFEQHTQVATPAHLLALLGGGNLGVHDGFPSISVKGKVFTVVADGNKTTLTTTDGEGNEFPKPAINVIVVGQTPGRSRTFFQGTFSEASVEKPTCHSNDGVKPASDAEEPQCTNCQACPQAVKGSKISEEGIATTACAVNKLLVISPSNKGVVNLDKLFRMRLAVTSLYDKDNPEEAKGWYAWDMYVKYLKSRGVVHTTQVETSIKFDPKAAYPKLLFRANGLINEDTVIKAYEIGESDKVKSYLGLSDRVATEVAKPATKEEIVDDGFGAAETVDNSAAEEYAKVEAAKKEAEAKAIKAAKAKAKKEAEEKAAKEAAEAKALAEAKAKETSKATVVEADDSLSAALASWDDE